jgi:hypothetical protein
VLYHTPFATNAQSNKGFICHVSFAKNILRKKVIALQKPAINVKSKKFLILGLVGLRPKIERLSFCVQYIMA